MSKNVHLVQVSPIIGEEKKSTYVPYAIGALAAYAWADKKISNNFPLGKFIYRRDNVDHAIDSLNNPYLVGFSSYSWNMEYNKAFAKKLKKRYPHCITVFGGHNILPDGSDLKDNSFIDIAIHGEGEIPFKMLLLALLEGSPLNSLNNISYRKADGSVITTEKILSPDITDFPSPYLNGCFDELIETEDLSFSLIWETNRGCPNQCAYCDWGELSSKIRKIPMERIKAEINWMADKKIEYVYCADANFAILDRDEKITDLIITSKVDKGYPQKFKTNFTKNRPEFVFKLGKKLMDYNVGKSPTLAFQSLNADVLKNIGRSNINLDHFKRMMALYNDIDAPAYTELILGLPGETYESFAQGICTLLESGQHKSIGVYPCELLPNSLLANPTYMKKYGIEAIKTRSGLFHCVVENDEVQEFTTIVISTDTMSVEDWKKSYMFSICIQGLHNIGLTRALAIYLYHENGISYTDFYEKLIAWFEEMNEKSICNQEYKLLRRLIDGAVAGENAFTCVFDGFGEITWGFEEHLFLIFARSLGVFFDELNIFMKTFDIEDDIFDNLIKFQKGIVKQLNQSRVEISFDYDLFNYFRNIAQNKYSPLKKASNSLYFEDKQPTSNWEDYAKLNLWYGRRDDALLYTSEKDLITIKYH